MDTELAEKRLRLAQAVVARIIYGEVTREGSEWVIRAPVRSEPGADIVFDLGRGNEDFVACRGSTFAEALDRAVARGAAKADEVNRRYEELLRAWEMASF